MKASCHKLYTYVKILSSILPLYIYCFYALSHRANESVPNEDGKINEKHTEYTCKNDDERVFKNREIL